MSVLKEFAKELIQRARSSGAIDATLMQDGYCETCYHEWAAVSIDDDQLDRDIDALCAEFADRIAKEKEQ